MPWHSPSSTARSAESRVCTGVQAPGARKLSMGTIPEGYLKPRDAASGGAVASYPLSLLLRPPADDLASLAGRPPHSIINRGVHKQQGINPGPQFDETSFFQRRCVPRSSLASTSGPTASTRSSTTASKSSLLLSRPAHLMLMEC